jgi:hypothetical protein
MAPPKKSKPKDLQSPTVRSVPILASLLFALVRLPPWLPKTVGMNLDQSWEWVTHESWRLGLDHGRELIFTFGPFGFLQTETYVPHTYDLMLAIYAALTVLLVIALWHIVNSAASSRWLAALWIVVFIESMSVWQISQSLFFHLSLLLLVGHWWHGSQQTKAWVVVEHVLAISLALSSLIKFTCFSFAAPVIVAIAVHDALRWRRPPWIVATFGGSWLALWLVAGQPLAGIGPFFRNSVEIAVGFGRTMGVAGPSSEIVIYLIASSLLILFMALALRAENGWWTLVPLGCLALLLFLLLKISFVRHDGHALTPAPLLLPWAFLLLFLSWSPRGVKSNKLVALGYLAATLFFTASVLRNHLDADLTTQSLKGVGSWPARVVAMGRVIAGAEHLRERHESAAADIRSKVPVPALSGTIDIYPHEGAVALAHGMSYRPRPLLHSYSAYTPRLSRIDAEHLRGPHAPENILFEVWPIDGRLPTLDDSLSWPELLTRYEFDSSVAGRYLLLKRSSRPWVFDLHHLADLKGRTGEVIRLPEATAGEMIWATVDLRATWRGRAAAAILKAPLPGMVVQQRDGTLAAYRVLPELLSAGFLLSPLITDTNDFRQLLNRHGSAALLRRQVEAIGIVSIDGAPIDWAFAPHFELSLWTLDIRRE